MKKYLLYLVAIVFYSTPVKAQYFSHGTITYTGSAHVPDNLKAAMAMAGLSSIKIIIEVSGKSGLQKTVTGSNVIYNSLVINGVSYRLDNANKVAYRSSLKDFKDQKANFKITKAFGSQVIAGYLCQKYITTAVKEGTPGSAVIWASRALRIDPSSMPPLNTKEGSVAMFYKNVDGIPLKVEGGGGGFSLELVATSILTAVPPASDFQIPAGYTVK